MEEHVRNIVLNLVPMILSLSVHEFAHAFAADRLGDDTPRRQERLTLSPLAHIDFWGTLVIPVVATLATSFALIGWARPVQFVPANLTRKLSMRTGTMIVAAAGPLSNLALAVASIAALAVIGPRGDAGTVGAFTNLLVVMFVINIGLFLFNLLPLPPLDGSRLLPRSMDELQAAIAPYSFLILLVLINVGPTRGLLWDAVFFVASGLDRIFGAGVVG